MAEQLMGRRAFLRSTGFAMGAAAWAWPTWTATATWMC